MGCPTYCWLGDTLVFSITTHDPDTGELTDADALPIWRLYEDETAVPILTGTMAALDAVNTTGFYTDLVACSVANGFEAGRTYTVYIEATVDADTGGISYAFKALSSALTAAEVWSYLYRTLTTPRIASARTKTGNAIAIKRGDTWDLPITGLGDLTGYVTLDFMVKNGYADADASAIIWIRLNATGLDDGLLVLNATDATARAANGSITIDSLVAGNVTLHLEAEETALLAIAGLEYDIQEITATEVTTILWDKARIVADVTRAIG